MLAAGAARGPRDGSRTDSASAAYGATVADALVFVATGVTATAGIIDV